MILHFQYLISQMCVCVCVCACVCRSVYDLISHIPCVEVRELFIYRSSFFPSTSCDPGARDEFSLIELAVRAFTPKAILLIPKIYKNSVIGRAPFSNRCGGHDRFLLIMSLSFYPNFSSVMIDTIDLTEFIIPEL